MAIDCPPELRGLSAAEGFAAVTDWSKINASPSGDKLALMSLGKLHVFNISGSDYFKGNAQTINLGNVGQTEGMVFTDNNNIVFCNESGQMFKYSF